jgi:hypothetical protein
MDEYQEECQDDDRRENHQEQAVLRLAEKLANMSQACKITGYSHDSSYRFRELCAEHG